MSTVRRTIEQLLDEYGEVIRPISGTSMLPMLRQNKDAVRLVKPPKRDLKAGELPLYRRPNGQYVLHRIAGVNKNTYLIRGDNCVAYEKVPKKWVVGLVDCFYRDGRLVDVNNEEYRLYVHNVLARGRPFVPKEYYYICQLYSSALLGKKPPEPSDDIDWNLVLSVCKRQMISACVARAVLMLQSKVPDAVIQAFEASFGKALRRQAMFTSELSGIINEFENKGIRYLPLKGAVINNLYPILGMREFADNDVFYEVSRQNDVKNIMINRGYDPVELRYIHDTYQKPPIFNFEFHKELFMRSSRFNSHFKDVFGMAVKDDGNKCGYHFEGEDFYIYFLSHYAKHHDGGGTGIRGLGDMYFVQQLIERNSNFDREYVDDILSRLNLCSFENQMKKLSDSLIQQGTLPDECIMDFFSASAYGSMAKMVETDMKNKGRFGYIINRLFPDINDLKIGYPILDSAPILLPFVWAHRIFVCLLTKDKLKNASFCALTALKKKE